MNHTLSHFPAPHTGLSFFGVVIGCIVGILLIPEQLLSPEDLQWSAIVFSTGILLGPSMAAIRQPESILHPISILLVGIVYWLLLDLIQARYLPIVWHSETIPITFFAIALFSTGVCLTGVFRVARLPDTLIKTAIIQFTPKLLFRLGLVAFLFGFLRFAIPADFDLLRMYNALFYSRWTAPWARGAYGGWNAFLDHMAYFGYVLPVLTVLLFRLEKKLTWRPIILGLMTVIIFLFVAQGGGRRIIGALVASASVVWVLTARRKGAAVIFISLFIVPALLVILQYILVSRRSGFGSVEGITATGLVTGGISVDDNFARLAQLIEIIPTFVPHVGFDWVIWILVRPIPRVFWPGKPDGYGFSLPDFLGMEGVSLTSSVVGESYMAFGFIGCLAIGLLFGYFARWFAQLLDYRMYPSAILMYGLGLLALFVGLRAAVEVLLFSYPIIAWIVLTYFMRRRKRRRVGVV